MNPVSKKYVDETTPREYEDIRDYVYKSLINERTNNLSLERSEIGEELIELVESCKNAENNQEKKKRIMMLRVWANNEIKNHEEILEEEQCLCSK